MSRVRPHAAPTAAPIGVATPLGIRTRAAVAAPSGPLEGVLR